MIKTYLCGKLSLQKGLFFFFFNINKQRNGLKKKLELAWMDLKKNIF